jgi:hypothetical protein
MAASRNVTDPELLCELASITAGSELWPDGVPAELLAAFEEEDRRGRHSRFTAWLRDRIWFVLLNHPAVAQAVPNSWQRDRLCEWLAKNMELGLHLGMSIDGNPMPALTVADVLAILRKRKTP